MHMVGKKDLNKAELETVRISKIPTTAVIANGEVPAKEEAAVYVRDLDLFVMVMLLEYTGSSFTWKTLRRIRVQLPLNEWPETTSHHKWQENALRHTKSCTIRRTLFIHEFLY